MAYASTSGNQYQRAEVWDYEYQCFRVNGILRPEPLSVYYPLQRPPSPPSSPPPPPPPPPSQDAGSSRQQPHESINYFRGRRRRNLTASRVLDIRTFSFHLFRCEDSKENILAMNEVATTNTTFYVLVPYITRGRIKLDAKEIYIGQRVISRVIGSIYPDLDNRSNLSIEQRLEGKWTIELRQRNGSMKTERFYTHERIERTFRSMNDVASFILLNVVY